MFIKKSALAFIFSFVFIFQIIFTHAAEPKFHAVYECIFDTEIDNIFIDKVLMSKDGEFIILSGKNFSNQPVLFRMKSNGSEFTQFTLPAHVMETVGYIGDITINGNGSVSYFYSGLRIYVVIGNSVTEIFNSDIDTDEFRGFLDLQTPYNGDVVFFKISEDYRGGSVWRLNQNGGSLTKVIDPLNVTHNLGKGAGLSAYAISDNAGVIAFTLLGYWDDEDVFHYQGELFVKTPSAVYEQLTIYSEYIRPGWLDISGDGNRIVYNKENPLDSLKHYYAIDSDGTNETVLAQNDIPEYNDMNYDGSSILLNDSRSKGRLAATDSTSEFDVIPLGINLTDVTLSYVNKICFGVNYQVGFRGVYVGYLYNKDIRLDNPIIENITFDPDVFPKNDPDAWIKLKAKVDNPDGLSEIDYVKINILYEGINKVMGYSFSQVYFPQQPYDNGNDPDDFAGDSIFTAYGKATNVFNDAETFKDQTYVRVVVHSNSKSFTIQDVLLNIEDATAVKDGELLSSPVSYSLSQNYPNPFNPSTKMNYSIPNQSYVTLKVFDVLGSEVATLVNEEQKPGYYEVKWNANNNSSGVYFYKIMTGDFIETKKMLMIK